MSLTARERHNPPSRRKSCAACIKAKRRCDFALPACLRCHQRSLKCDYPVRALRRPPVTPQATVNNAPEQPTILEEFTLLAEDQPSNPFADLLTPPAISENGSIERDSSHVELPIDHSPLDLIFQPSEVAGPTTQDLQPLAGLIRDRLQYSIDELKKAPAQMVQETCTPWSHPELYKHYMPSAILDAHACCALYIAKNRLNSGVIFRSIDLREASLLAAPAAITAMDCLAHTQALILYQIMRLFDGDIAARAAAERAIPALESSAICLMSHVDFETSGPVELSYYPLGPTKEFWEGWVFQESARRTLLFSFFFIQAYRIVAGHYKLNCDHKLGLVRSWTMSAHLWRAKTAVEFAEAWKAKEHYVIKDLNFESMLREAHSNDIDDFGKIMLASMLGKDEAEGWFKARGGNLHEESVNRLDKRILVH